MLVSKFKLTAAAALLIGAALSTSSVSARQVTGFYYDYTFYSDASHSSVVGSYKQFCDGTRIHTPQVTGMTSAYFTREILGQCPGLGDW